MIFGVAWIKGENYCPWVNMFIVQTTKIGRHKQYMKISTQEGDVPKRGGSAIILWADLLQLFLSQFHLCFHINISTTHQETTVNILLRELNFFSVCPLSWAISPPQVWWIFSTELLFLHNWRRQWPFYLKLHTTIMI